VFGKVLSGLDTVYKIEAEGRQNGVPKHQIVVLHSGKIMPL
jgi:peptidylprolyl isomerase